MKIPLLTNELFNFFAKRRQIVLDDAPNNDVVHGVVAVNNAVAERNDSLRGGNVCGNVWREFAQTI